MSERKWIGLFDHWQPKANPLTVLAPTCFILTASEIMGRTKSESWLREKIGSVDRAGRYLLSRKSENGLISGAGFYVECPPRNQWDGVTQCYVVKAFRDLAGLHRMVGDPRTAGLWTARAEELGAVFQRTFWRGDHFAEYVHPEHGVVDFHGLSDVNWAAIASGVAAEDQVERVWPLLVRERSLWHGDMPTQLVSMPYGYREWELNEPLPFEKSTGPLYDVAAMGRVWFLEATACLRTGQHDRLRDSVRKVCRMGQRHRWYWYERYHPLQVWDVFPAGPRGYCEYPAILVRVVLGNPDVFSK